MRLVTEALHFSLKALLQSRRVKVRVLLGPRPSAGAAGGCAKIQTRVRDSTGEDRDIREQDIETRS